MLRRHSRFLLLFLIPVILSSCVKKSGAPFGAIEVPATGGSSTPTSGGPTSVPPTQFGILQVGTVWEGPGGQPQSECNFQSATLEESGSAASASCDTVTTFYANCPIPNTTPDKGIVPCTANIPEGSLYYGNLRFKFKASSGQCAIVSFQPYFYRASVANNFVPMWNPTSAPIDCSAARATNPDCYEGVAKAYMGSSFPERIGKYTVFGTKAGEWNNIMESANKNGNRTNRWASNGLSSASKACMPAGTKKDILEGGIGPVRTGDGFVCGIFDDTTSYGMVDYWVSCQDEFLRPLWSVRIIVNALDDRNFPQALNEQQQESWWNYNY